MKELSISTKKDLLVSQGIEVETFIRELTSRNEIITRASGKQFPEEVHDYLTKVKLIDNVWDKYTHYDTANCTEIPIKHDSNLEQFANRLRAVMSNVIEYCNKNNYLCMSYGKLPNGEGEAGCHIHTSSNHYGNIDIKDIIYPYQPLLALLSQNSNFNDIGQLRINSGDGRLSRRVYPSLHHNSEDNRRVDNCSEYCESYDCELSYCAYEGQTNEYECTDCDHYIHDCENCDEYQENEDSSLRLSRYDDVEIRYPNSANYHQLLTISTFIKACIFSKINPINFDYNVSNAVNSVMSSQDNAITFLKLRKSTSVLNINHRLYIPVSMNILFKLITSTPTFKEGLNKALSELSSKDKTYVLDAFKLISDGYTFTDFYNSIFSKLKSTISRCKELHKIDELAYLKDVPVWKLSNITKPKISNNDIKRVLENNIYKTYSHGNNNCSVFRARDLGIEDELNNLLDPYR